MKNIKILVACEESGEVRDAFRALGFEAWSCDMADSRTPSEFHIKRDVMEVLAEGWDCLIGFPPCTYIANSSVQWLTNIPKNPNPKILYGPPRVEAMKHGASFFLALWNCGIKHVVLENPIMHGRAKSIIGIEPAQIIQPYMFGHGETKQTCFWLKNLPPLMATHAPDDMFALPEPKEREAKVFNMSPGPNRARDRSKTYTGVAAAMAAQWGDYLRKIYA